MMDLSEIFGRNFSRDVGTALGNYGFYSGNTQCVLFKELLSRGEVPFSLRDVLEKRLGTWSKNPVGFSQ